jgi:hypothetical protein
MIIHIQIGEKLERALATEKAPHKKHSSYHFTHTHQHYLHTKTLFLKRRREKTKTRVLSKKPKKHQSNNPHSISLKDQPLSCLYHEQHCH